MPCNLVIMGTNLDPDAFIKRCKLRFYKKVYKGEPKYKSKPDGEKTEHSFLILQTSKADFDNITKQINETIQYLKRNKEKLKNIRLDKKVDRALLDFGFNLRIDYKKVFVQNEVFSSELLKLAGNLGIELYLSIYPNDLEDQLEKNKLRRNQNSA